MDKGCLRDGSFPFSLEIVSAPWDATWTQRWLLDQLLAEGVSAVRSQASAEVVVIGDPPPAAELIANAPGKVTGTGLNANIAIPKAKARSAFLRPFPGPLMTSTITPATSRATFAIGNERFGVESDTLAAVDAICRIPVRGSKNSMNVGVAFGIAAFEWLRQYQKAPR